MYNRVNSYACSFCLSGGATIPPASLSGQNAITCKKKNIQIYKIHGGLSANTWSLPELTLEPHSYINHYVIIILCSSLFFSINLGSAVLVL